MAEPPGFWGKKDNVSVARSLRLVVIQNCFDQDLLTEEQAREVLAGSLVPDDDLTVFDDSQWLGWKPTE